MPVEFFSGSFPNEVKVNNTLCDTVVVKMVLDIALSRLDNTTPFGFKLVGGADFDVPLQVVKIIPGSIAEEVGMHVGDVVARINDIPTNNLSYYDAHQLLACAGNRFVVGILRLVSLVRGVVSKPYVEIDVVRGLT